MPRSSRFALAAVVFLCGLGLIAWLLVWFLKSARSWLGPAIGLLLICELMWFAQNRNPQCDPALYFPRLPVLERLAKASPGRVLGIGCLPERASGT